MVQGKAQFPANNSVQRDHKPSLLDKVNRYTVVLMAASIVACAILWAFFALPHLTVDDVGFFNPVYMYLHTGKMTDPAYLYFHSMVIHPPTHYLIMAWFMKLGVPLQYAPSMAPFLFILLTIVLLVRSRFTPEIKLALLFGFFAGSLFFIWGTGPNNWKHISGPMSFGLRPDVHLAFAWFAGLVALESGRLQEWNPLRLGLGAFLLTYASGIHYPATFAWTGVLVYLVWMIRERGWRESWRPIWALVLGGCAFGIPYLLLFVIPRWQEIVYWVTNANATAGSHASIGEQLKLYQLIYNGFPPGQFTRILYAPVAVGLSIPIATIILVSMKQTRGLILAALPNLLFLLLLVQRKWAIYLLPELMLYVCSVSILFALASRAIVEKLGPQRHWSFVPFLGLFFTGALILGALQLKIAEIPLKPLPDVMAIARAAGRQMLGPHALVGVRLSRNYSDGGDLSYMIEPDVLWKNIEDVDLKEYFGQFDAIVEDQHMSDASYNGKQESLSSWYAERQLNLHGFFLSDLGAGYMLLSPNPSARLEGYALHKDGEVVHFLQDPKGTSVFAALSCNVGQWSRLHLETSFFNPYLLPARAGGQKELELFIMQSDQYQAARSKIADACAIRDEVTMTTAAQDTKQLLDTLKGDVLIHFYEALSDAMTARYGPEEVVAMGPGDWPVKLHFVRGRHQGEEVSLTGESATTLFHSDMDNMEGWWASPQKKVQGLQIVTSGLKMGEQSGDFKTDKWGGYIVSEYKPTPKDSSDLYFFAWVKTIKGDSLPKLSLEDEGYYVIGLAGTVIQGKDGWTLLGGCVHRPKASQTRLLIQQDNNMESLVDKVLLVAASSKPSQSVGLKENEGSKLLK